MKRWLTEGEEMRRVRFVEERSGLSARCDLLEDEAPESAAFLWDLAQRGLSFDAVHAMWTGPEISVPMPASMLPEDLSRRVIPEENATSFPVLGEIVLAYAGAGTLKGLPPGPFFDIGLFYGEGGRLLMPFGWLRANVCARIVQEDLAQAQADMKTIRRNGACRLVIQTD
ncbi:DUF3830 family protein [Brevundimonas diminuta]|uniref:DUF3830 family protein n=1 Tax=Brevundimonas diminuta TaxID=293 RepID=UPI0032099D56